MQNEYKGAVFGAAVGDALGMPNETLPLSRCRLSNGYQKAAKYHPNANLQKGSYTDDTQILLMLGELFVSGNASVGTYSRGLRNLFTSKAFRFPDGTVTTACRHLISDPAMAPGCNSTTSGCLPLGLAFALVYPDINDIWSKIIPYCEITHTSHAVHAAVLSFATLINSTLNDDDNPVYAAHKNAFLEDKFLGQRTGLAIQSAADNLSLESAVSLIGNDVSVYQTLPLSYYLISRFGEEDNFLNIVASVGGNSDTIGFICGAWYGAEYGLNAIPDDLLIGLENRESIGTLADRMYMRYGEKLKR